MGRNYVDHAKEMGHTGKEPPFFFMKPASSTVAVEAGQVGQFPYPGLTNKCDFEAELVVAIHKSGYDISSEKAMDHVFGYAVGLDMTRRDMQAEAKKASRPWDASKGFDFSAPVGPLTKKEDF